MLISSAIYQFDRLSYKMTNETGSLMPQETLNDVEVLNRARALVSKSKIVWTRHVEERMTERGFDRSQVKECLLSGAFNERPHIPNRFGSIEYKFTMVACVDGERIEVAASLVPDQHVVAITVIDIN